MDGPFSMKSTEQTNIPEELLDYLRIQASRDFPPGVIALADAAREIHGDSVRAVLFYGSCLRTGDVQDGLADLYLLVDDYRSAFKGRVLASLNKLLPPNVFYLEKTFKGNLLRAKYAVLSLADFRNGTKRWFHSYIWGRFAQRCGLIYVRDEFVALQVHEALASAVMTFVVRTLPQMNGPFTARDLWARGLSLSYRSELRTEPSDGAARLFDADPDYYHGLTSLALAAGPNAVSVIAETTTECYQVQVPAQLRRQNKLAWRARAVQGKILSVLRLLKGLLTFKGGVDYILWKIERHSGVRVEVSPTLKRIPPVAAIVIFWKLYRRNAFR